MPESQDRRYTPVPTHERVDAPPVASPARAAADTGQPPRVTEDWWEIAERGVGVGVFDFDIAADRHTWSAEIYRLHGIAPGTPPSTEAWLAAVHPEDRARMRAAISALTGVPRGLVDVRPDALIENEYRAVLADGAVRWIASRLRVMPGADGRPARLLGVNFDITARKRAEAALRESEDHYRHTVDLNPQVPWTAAPNGGLLHVSQRWLELTGMTFEQARGRGWMLAVHPDDLPDVRGAWVRALESGAPYDVEYRVRLADGSYRWMRARAFPRRDTHGRLLRWYGTNEDVHDRREAEIELREARERADEANRAKSEFLAMMSHELRTPLNAILGYAQLMEMGLHGPVTEAQKDGLARIVRAQHHLLTLINDILSFAKLEAGQAQLDIGDVSLAELCARIDALVGPQVAAKHLAYACDLGDPAAPHGSPLVARADRERVLQILVNLVTNAVKYTGEGGAVTVDAAADAGRVAVRVRDTGRGVAPDHLESIFQPFVQVDRTRGGREGVGLGLAISRDLARAMGGDVTVESTEGVGSTFTLTLQRAGVPR